jgi:hypothetical protein
VRVDLPTIKPDTEIAQLNQHKEQTKWKWECVILTGCDFGDDGQEFAGDVVLAQDVFVASNEPGYSTGYLVDELVEGWFLVGGGRADEDGLGGHDRRDGVQSCCPHRLSRFNQVN